MVRKEFLVSNDDGYFAGGLLSVARFLREYGNITAVAPSEPQSGKSASLTLDRILRMNEVSFEQASDDLGSLRMISLSGTPADCVKMGVNLFLDEKGKLPDMLVSGINHGSNASVAAVYSGTLGACAEGTIYGVPSVGLSINSHDVNYPLDAVLEYTRKIMDLLKDYEFKKGTYLNINFPALPFGQIKGIRVARSGRGRWVKEFFKQTDPHGEDYYWMTGTFENFDQVDEEGCSDGDHLLVENGYISIVPMMVDNTDYSEIERLRTFIK